MITVFEQKVTLSEKQEAVLLNRYNTIINGRIKPATEKSSSTTLEENMNRRDPQWILRMKTGV